MVHAGHGDDMSSRYRFVNVRASHELQAGLAAQLANPGWWAVDVRPFSPLLVPQLGGLHVDADPDTQDGLVFRVRLVPNP